MALNSTRKQIKDQGRKMLYDVENAMMRLKRIDELGESKSPVINAHVPILLNILDQAHIFVEAFRQKL